VILFLLLTLCYRTGGGFKNDRDAPAKQRDSGKGGSKKGEGQQKGHAAKKNISLAKLREETKTKGNRDGDKKVGKKFARFRKGGKSSGNGKPPKKTGSKVPRDPVERKEFLDKEIENYWLKGGHTEMVSKRLDQDLEEYFKKTDEEAGEAEAPAIKADEPEKEE